jgi:hypothetical protein
MGEASSAGIWWRKSSYSGGDNNCVEVGTTGAGIAVRDSKNPDSDALAVGAGAWQAFTGSLCSGRNSTAS